MGLFSKKKESDLKVQSKQVTTRIVIPLKGIHTFNTNEFVKTYRGEWGGKVAVREIGGQAIGVRRYELSEERERLALVFNNNPLPRSLVEASVNMARSSALPNKLDDSDAKEFLDHAAHGIIENTVTPDTGRIQCAFTVQTLLSLMKQTGTATGYNVISSQIYRSRSWLQSMLNKNPKMDSAFIFVLLGNVHAVRNGELWVHTHGMEQFGAPDIEVRFHEEGRLSYFTELIGNAAIYATTEGPVLKIGDTTEMGGDGIVYRIIEGRDEPEHPFGAFGAIGISKK